MNAALCSVEDAKLALAEAEAFLVRAESVEEQPHAAAVKHCALDAVREAGRVLQRIERQLEDEFFIPTK